MSDTSDTTPDVTQILKCMNDGDPKAAGRLMDVVYHELHRLAHARMRNEKAGHTLQTTALVNEMYIRLLGGKAIEWKDRRHFFGVAANAMRQILVEYARKRDSVKRGGGLMRETLDEQMQDAAQSVDLILLDQALTEFENIYPDRAEVIKLRYILGFTAVETAKMLDLGLRTVMKYSTFAQGWLNQRMSEPDSQSV